MVNTVYYSLLLIAVLAGLVASECPTEAHWLQHLRCLLRPEDFPVLQIQDGAVGGECTSTLGRDICAWKGIPFASPPLRELRFMPPTPPSPWANIRWTFDFGSTCIGTLVSTGSEDCLFVNVYVPRGKCSVSSPCSVMIWVYGGAFIAGSGNSGIYGPEHFMDEGVIIVTFNYRVGPFGFTSTETSDIPGNAGLLDQQAAFRWVQNNIEAFGGNKNSVTIFGQSAGGASVSYHCLSSGSAGLFNRAIMQSGSALSDWAIERKPRQVAEKLANGLGLQYNDATELAAKLKSVPARELNSVARRILLDDYNIQEVIMFAPHVDYNDPPFINDIPQNVVKQLSANNQSICHGADIMSGMTLDEGGFARVSMLLDPLYLVRLPFNTEGLTPKYCNLEPGSSESRAVGTKIFRRYFGIVPTEWDLFRYVTASHFATGEAEFNKAYLKSGQKAYNYIYNYCGPANYLRNVLFPITTCRRMGAVHADELFLMWTQTGIELPGILSIIEDAIQLASQSLRTRAEQRLSKQMVGSFANFAKTGEPTPTEAVGSLFGVRWEPSTDSENVRVYNFDRSLSMSRHPHEDDLAFWADVCNPK